MRNAVSNFDEDFAYAGPTPTRKTASRKGRSSSAKPKARKKKNGRFAVDMRKVARYAAVGMSATVVVGIMVNALMMQKGHHPAPLFGQNTIGLSPVAPAPAPKVARATSPDPELQVSQASPATSAAPTPAPTPVPVVRPRRVAAPSANEQGTGNDQIATLLKTGSVPPSNDKDDTKTILSVQKALAKLGFALKPNGTMGPATRKAIEAFEKERNMPLNSDLSPRLVRILAAESGVKID